MTSTLVLVHGGTKTSTMWDDVGRHADARIPHFQPSQSVVTAEPDEYVPTGACKFECVVEQVQQQTLEPFRIAGNDWVVGALAAQCQALGLRDGFDLLGAR